MGDTSRRPVREHELMPRLDQTGPWGKGPRTGRGAGVCLGQESGPTPTTVIEAERPPTTAELALWNRAKSTARSAILTGYVVRLQYRNLLLTHQFAAVAKVSFDEPELVELEPRMFSALSEIEQLRQTMCDVEQLELGVRRNENDLDIIRPPAQTLGWIIPAVVGAVIVVGIIARWAYLEKEVQTISDQYNGVLRRADLKLCKDPGSQLCKDWEKAKENGGYYKRETLIDSVKAAVTKVGGAVTTGLGAGLALLIPLLAFLYLPRSKR